MEFDIVEIAKITVSGIFAMCVVYLCYKLDWL